MTAEAFITFYPQFINFTPREVLTEYLRLANARFSSLGDDTAEARRLFTAHKLTLYAAACPPEDPSGTAQTMTALASSGARPLRVTSRKVGEVAVSYGSAAGPAVSASFADLSETSFGLQLQALLRLHSFPIYVP